MGTSRLSDKSGEMLRGNLAMDQHPIQGGSSYTSSLFMRINISIWATAHLPLP